ncbi:hypothetical protein PG996_012751 [Apiospora saccharicola]|uniref:Xylanolytic transcriptional activator regulatory domain-containing protein n=1 Tax=Apiospora saccharicola TaxID=335842 RepID=A0ABR1U5X0_9PEZI
MGLKKRRAAVLEKRMFGQLDVGFNLHDALMQNPDTDDMEVTYNSGSPLFAQDFGSGVASSSAPDTSTDPIQMVPEALSPPQIIPGPSPEASRATPLLVTDCMRAELCHCSTPLFDPLRYSGWASQRPWPSKSHMCLQHAVWTIAASRSSQFHSMQDPLYQETRKMLHGLEFDDEYHEIPFRLQRLQAVILVAIYEFAQNLFHRAWTTSGQAIRAVQMMRLYCLDEISVAPLNRDQDRVTMEEMRRAFWMVYFVDTLFCGIDGIPLTLGESGVSIRLPAAGFEDEGEQSVNQPYLSELVTASATSIENPMAQCIIFATLWAKIISNSNQGNDTNDGAIGSMDYYERFAATLKHRSNLFFKSYSPSRVQADPLLFFAGLLAHCTTLSFGRIATLNRVSSGGPWDQLASDHEPRITHAADEIGRLLKLFPRVSFLKIHPLLAIPLAHGTKFLAAQSDQEADGEADMLRVVRMFHKLGESKFNANSSWDLLTLPVSWVEGNLIRNSGLFS